MPHTSRLAVALGLCLALAIPAVQAQKQSTTSGTMSQMARADRQMLVDIAQANAAEIETGKLALEKSQNASVKQFAQKMIDDHTQGLAETTQLASSKGVDIPAEPDAKHKAMATAMKALSGDSFDKQYMAQAGLRDHRATHELLQKTQRNAKDPELKALATKLMPIVSGHLQSAEQLSKTK
jgi:putative membrane protein